jgi:hypothetical protein
MWKNFLQFSLSILFSLMMPGALLAQDNLYHYSVDLTRVTNDDQLMVELQTPAVNQKTIQFYIPKIIPGTYEISDFGMFVSEVKAYNSIQLVFDQGRWWITSILWNAERNDNPQPKELQKKTK